jgi:hypothetical protein
MPLKASCLAPLIAAASVNQGAGEAVLRYAARRARRAETFYEKLGFKALSIGTCEPDGSQCSSS